MANEYRFTSRRLESTSEKSTQRSDIDNCMAMQLHARVKDWLNRFYLVLKSKDSQERHLLVDGKPILNFLPIN